MYPMTRYRKRCLGTHAQRGLGKELPTTMNFCVNGLECRIHDPYVLSSFSVTLEIASVIDRKKITRPITGATRQLDPTEAIIYDECSGFLCPERGWLATSWVSSKA